MMGCDGVDDCLFEPPGGLYAMLAELEGLVICVSGAWRWLNGEYELVTRYKIKKGWIGWMDG